MESNNARLRLVVFGFDAGWGCNLLMCAEVLVVGFWSDNAAANRLSSVIPCCPLFRADDCGGSGASLENSLSSSDIDVVALVGRESLSCFDECVIEILALVTTEVLDKGENIHGIQEYLLVSVPEKNRWRS